MNNAKYAFYYLLSLVALVFVAINSGIVIFQIINKMIPDGLNNYTDSVNQEMLRFAIASLVFATPVFYWMNQLIRRGLSKGEINLTDAIRRWLTYFIIFVSSVVMLVWLITTMNSFLNGELTLKVILKTVTILIISGSIFGYYFYDIRQTAVKAKDLIANIFCYGSLVLVLVVFVAGLFFMDKPSMVRDQRHDQTVINNFSQIDSAINQYYQVNKKLPGALSELQSASGIYIRQEDLVDPLTKTAYDYKLTADTTYQLCADFKLATDKDDNRSYAEPKWDHQAGYQCLTSVVNKQEVRPETKPMLVD
jgi:hypothetical protein